MKTFMLLSKLLECQSKSYLNVLRIIKRKAAQILQISAIQYKLQETQIKSNWKFVDENQLCEKLIGVKIDYELTFD